MAPEAFWPHSPKLGRYFSNACIPLIAKGKKGSRNTSAIAPKILKKDPAIP